MDESRKMLGTLAFYPTLAYNLLRNYVQPSKWQWYSRVDENLILGALPFKSMVSDLKAENVGGVVCCTEEFETKVAYSGMDENEWKKEDILFHHIPMTDFVGMLFLYT
jgi:atypical dual specificity phosphatase